MADRKTTRTFAQTAREFYSWLYYEGFVRRTLNRTVETRMLGFTLTVPPSVFHPRFYFTSRILGQHILQMDLRGKHVLDAGCGSGILSLAAASVGAQVTSLDINPAAVAATMENAFRNGQRERIRVIESDMCAELPDVTSHVDMIITNPPYYQEDPHTPAELAFKGGTSNQFMTKLAEASSTILSEQGSVLTILSTDVDEATVLKPFAPDAFRRTTLSETHRLFERLRVFRLERCKIVAGVGRTSSI